MLCLSRLCVPLRLMAAQVVLESKAICKLVDGLDKAPLGGDEVDRAAVDQLVEVCGIVLGACP